MNAFSRSWELTKLSIEVMKKDKELFLFPVISGLFSLLFLLAMVVPTIILPFVFDKQSTVGPFFYLIVFLTYFGLALIATFFNVCVVYTVKTRFEGKNATFMDSLKFSFSRINIIVAWSLVSATVGLILRAIDDMAERMGGIGELLVKITTSILGAAWAIITIFVVPAMVYDHVGPFAAIRKSAVTLKKTWGESLIRYVGFGLAELVLIVLGVVVFLVLAIVGLMASIWVFLSILFLAAVYFVAVIVFFNLANAIFNTALYHYAQTGKAPKGFSDAMLKEAFQSKR